WRPEADRAGAGAAVRAAAVWGVGLLRGTRRGAAPLPDDLHGAGVQRPYARQAVARGAGLVVPLSVTVRRAARRRGAARGGGARYAAGHRDQRAASRGRVSPVGAADRV